MATYEDEKLAHFWMGALPLAFILSTPGHQEKTSGRPVAGATGDNLAFALEYLHSCCPALFPSPDRYCYRITNAYSKPIAKSLGHRSSEASDSEIRTAENVTRVLNDLKGCDIVILCGLKARLLSGSISGSGRRIACVCHTSNRGLSSTYSNQEISKLPTPSARRRHRAELWAQEVLECLTS